MKEKEDDENQEREENIKVSKTSEKERSEKSDRKEVQKSLKKTGKDISEEKDSPDGGSDKQISVDINAESDKLDVNVESEKVDVNINLEIDQGVSGSKSVDSGKKEDKQKDSAKSEEEKKEKPSIKSGSGKQEEEEESKSESEISSSAEKKDKEKESSEKVTNKKQDKKKDKEPSSEKKEGKEKEQSSHDEHGKDHHKQMMQDFKKRFWVSLIITVPILALSEMVQNWLGFELVFPGSDYIEGALGAFIYFYGGWPFLTGLVDELKKKSPGMMTLIGVAITVAWAYSLAITLGMEGVDFYWELATLIVIMLLGHWIEMKSVMGASRALEELMELMPDTANRITEDGETEKVKLSELKNGDKIRIKPGEKIPANGIVTDGKSSVNESMLTGESKPVEKKQGDEVIGGSVNESGSLNVKVEKTGEESYLNQMVEMVKEAQKSQSKTQRLADKAAFVLTIISLGGGFLTFFIWYILLESELVFAVERMVTVMVISCPHALGLAIPLVVAISTSISAQNGLLIRNRSAFEMSRKLDLILFDKTGTLTKGEFGVKKISSLDEDWDEEKILIWAASMEEKSEHPLAAAILKKAKDEQLELLDAEDYENITGQGIKGTIEGKKTILAGSGYLKEQGIKAEAESEPIETVIYLVVEGEAKGYLALADEVREDSKEAVKTLHDNDIEVYMITGDNEDVAKAVSEELGIEGYFAGVLPDAKQEKVKEFQEKGKIVAMTGDGVNDAPALAQANVGIAVGSGTDVAAETADIILVNSNPKDIVSLILFGKATYKKMVQNLFWATAYNVVAIPLAAGVLYNQGILVDPAIGAIIMSASTVIVAINAQLLRYKLK